MQFLIAFTIAVAFWPGVSNVATTPKWAIAGIASACFARWHTCVAFFAAYALLTVTWAPNTYDALGAYALLFVAILAFTWGYHADSIAGIIKGLAFGLAVSGVLAILQTAGYELPIEQGVAPSGLFFNKNIMGEAAALGFIACINWQSTRYYAVLCLPALLLSQCRAAWLAVACSLFLMADKWTRLWMLFVIIFTVYHIYPQLTVPDSIWERLLVWQDAVQQLTFWGHGIGSYAGASIDTVRARTYEMHNDWLQMVYELGVIGAAPVFAIVVRTFGPFVLCLFIIAFFGFPLHLPVTSWFAALVCGHLLGNSTVRGRALLCERLEREPSRFARLCAFGLPIR